MDGSTCDVFIAGTGPVGATYARIILDAIPDATVIMADVGSQDGPIIGGHHGNSVRYQKDADQFVNVIRGALQPISIPLQDTLISNLGGQGWRPPESSVLVFHGSNPQQKPELNLKGSAITRTVGGMGTHWTCCCPTPHAKERKELEKSIPWGELNLLLTEAGKYLNVHDDQFEKSVRQTLAKIVLEGFNKDRVKSSPLAVKRRTDNPNYVTWTGSDTILGSAVGKRGFKLLAEHLVTKVVMGPTPHTVRGVELRDLNKDKDNVKYVLAKAVVLCCGAVLTPQVLYNSGITPDTLPALGHYLSEQSLTFCQVVLKQGDVDGIPKQGPWGRFEHVKDAILKHMEEYKNDPLRIPFTDPEPQIILPYSDQHPWHVQIHRGAFSYGEEIRKENCVTFGPPPTYNWVPGVKDIYGMPQPTFHVRRSPKDHENDQKMMADMTRIADALGSYLPGSYPQFMEPGLALHITGTTRIGKDQSDSVANSDSMVHGFENLWVGGNGCIPDSTACNPTRTSVAIAIKGAQAVVRYLVLRPQQAEE